MHTEQEERIPLTLIQASNLLRRAGAGSRFFVKLPLNVYMQETGNTQRVYNYVPVSRNAMLRLLRETVAQTLGIPVGRLTRGQRERAQVTLTMFARPSGKAYDYWL